MLQHWASSWLQHTCMHLCLEPTRTHLAAWLQRVIQDLIFFGQTKDVRFSHDGSKLHCKSPCVFASEDGISSKSHLILHPTSKRNGANHHLVHQQNHHNIRVSWQLAVCTFARVKAHNLAPPVSPTKCRSICTLSWAPGLLRKCLCMCAGLLSLVLLPYNEKLKAISRLPTR